MAGGERHLVGDGTLVADGHQLAVLDVTAGGGEDRTVLLESWHPRGPGAGVVVMGTGAPAALVRSANDDGTLLFVCPSARERGDERFIAAVVAEVSRRGEEATLLLAGPGRSLRRAVLAAGLRPCLRLLHLPSVEASRMVAPVGGPAATFARTQLLDLRATRRWGVRALALPGLTGLGPTTELLGRPSAPEPAQWLARLDPSLSAATAVALTSGRAQAATVLLRFAPGGRTPDRVVKLGGRADHEADALARLGPAAARGGARVPRVISAGERAGRSMLVQNALKGEAWSRRLRGRPAEVSVLMSQVGQWLERFNAATARRPGPSAQQLEAVVLGAVDRLGVGRNLGAYRERLREMCARLPANGLPWVAVHNDLTAANLLRASDGLAVIDWEQAAAEGLPLGDLAYATVDTVAAVSGYGDRRGAFDSCFTASGAFAGLTRRLIVASAGALELAPTAVELCLHACWLAHASNELDRPQDGAHRPFGDIVSTIAAGPPLWEPGLAW